jgi:hypothetical protein
LADAIAEAIRDRNSLLIPLARLRLASNIGLLDLHNRAPILPLAPRHFTPHQKRIAANSKF